MSAAFSSIRRYFHRKQYTKRPKSDLILYMNCCETVLAKRYLIMYIKSKNMQYLQAATVWGGKEKQESTAHRYNMLLSTH